MKTQRRATGVFFIMGKISTIRTNAKGAKCIFPHPHGTNKLTGSTRIVYGLLQKT